MFSRDFALRQIYVKGEVSNCKYHTSGHIYFTLKDGTGALSAVMFAGNRGGLHFVMHEGQQVIVLGSISVYERDGTYQLYAREIRLDGQGDLYQQLEERKARLAEMGMFAPEYKQPIPRFAARIGIVTASTGAAIRDIVNVSHRRNPYVQLILYPAIVQGERAAASIVRGIETLDEMGLDCLIVGRGGGSIEDLWAFNEESVARAIFDCRTPVISAVGHETDTTIADYVADLRAPTPSAAAELAVCDLADVLGDLATARQRLTRLMTGKLSESRVCLLQSSRRLERLTPRHTLEERRQGVINRERQMQERMRESLEGNRHRLALASARLEALSPLARMQSGYAFVTAEDGSAVRSAQQVEKGSRITVNLQDGQLDALVQEKTLYREETQAHG
ncbi:MAG: exodeoxyribonuclease VII large subunit [Lachnospiraceae bacterium]|nr:exodeoxyribonuclease VII large subunit [Lachnospiraceae bacterium]